MVVPLAGHYQQVAAAAAAAEGCRHWALLLLEQSPVVDLAIELVGQAELAAAVETVPSVSYQLEALYRPFRDSADCPKNLLDHRSYPCIG